MRIILRRMRSFARRALLIASRLLRSVKFRSVQVRQPTANLRFMNRIKTLDRFRLNSTMTHHVSKALICLQRSHFFRALRSL